MSGHTPGPWDFNTSPQPNGCPTVGARGLMVCMVAHSVNLPGQRETALANASLIAAAPDLLEALEAAMAFIDSHAADPDLTDEMCRAYQRLTESQPKAAIAKARGQS